MRLKGRTSCIPRKTGIFLKIMEEYPKMKRRIYLTTAVLVIGLALAYQPAWAEHVSFKLSFSTNSVTGNDINPWIESFNRLWQDWRSLNGGDLQGQFTPINYANGLEVEIRIPLYRGLSLNLAGGRYSSDEEGVVSFQHADASQIEEQYLSNKVTAWPLKIGFSYLFTLPPLPKAAVVAGFGRHIIFASYDSINNYKLQTTTSGKQFTYLINKTNEYSSEALGYYAHFGVEWEVLKFLAIVVEGEKVWNSLDGFKGSYTYELLEEGNEDSRNFTQRGDASLYLYESDSIDTGTFYSVLAGHEDRPEGRLDFPFAGNWPIDSGFPTAGPEVRNVRQGELDFNHISFKIGIRFKF